MNEVISKEPDERVVKFIREHHILTLATSNNNEPYCATCFYVFDRKRISFIFTSDMETKHAQDMLKQSKVSGTIALETSMIGKIRGIQFTGSVKILKGDELKSARLIYIKKFPVAMLKKTTLWEIDADYIKMTDNRLGFGKKIRWKKEL
jgi:uncharacterized protein